MSKKWVSVIICLVVLAGVIGLMQWKASFADEELVESVQETTATDAPVETTTSAVSEQQPNTVPPATYYNVEPNGALSVGASDAPITLLEFSSFSCPHCATFHKTSLAPIKKDYVDTGKVRIIFMDFPLNRQALDATLLARCVETENRYDFMNMLFEQQNQWAFVVEHRDKLVQYGTLVGLTREQALSCMNDTNKERDLLTTMKMISERYGVTSTPSFVVLPGEQKVAGAQPYGTFSQIFESLLAE